MKKQNKIVSKEIKEDIEIKILKSKIEMAKTGFDRYVEVLVRSAFIETCTGGAYFDGLFHDLLKNGYKHVDKADISQKDKDKLIRKWFFGGMFGENLSEKEKLESELKYWKSLESWAKHNLTGLNEDLKKKIVIDSIKQQQLWSKQFDRNSELYKRLEELETNKSKKKGE